MILMRDNIMLKDLLFFLKTGSRTTIQKTGVAPSGKQNYNNS